MNRNRNNILVWKSPPPTRSVPINDWSNMFSCSPIGVPWLPPDMFNCANLEIPPWSTCISRACAGSMHHLSQNCVSLTFTTCHKTMYLVQNCVFWSQVRWRCRKSPDNSICNCRHQYPGYVLKKHFHNIISNITQKILNILQYRFKHLNHFHILTPFTPKPGVGGIE